VTAIRARVKGGRLLVDEPTDLPEGLEVSLAIVDDDVDHTDRAGLEASIAESYAQADRGEIEDAREVLASLRAKGSLHGSLVHEEDLIGPVDF
jgi:hypothetical protein